MLLLPMLFVICHRLFLVGFWVLFGNYYKLLLMLDYIYNSQFTYLFLRIINKNHITINQLKNQEALIITMLLANYILYNLRLMPPSMFGNN